MLCDDLVVDTDLPKVYDGLGRTLLKIQRAQKFILSREYTLAADGLVDNKRELEKVAPYCRLPYPLTWIEFVHTDRPHWDPSGPYRARPVNPDRHQHEPHRVGLLLEQIGEHASRWKTHLFWKMKDIPDDARSPHNGSIAAMMADSEKAVGAEPLVDMVRVEFADFGRKLLDYIFSESPDVATRIGQYAIEDWGGEFRFMIAILGLLNTRNVAEKESVDYTRQNAKRARRGGRQLFSYNLLKIRPGLIASRARKSDGDDPEHHMRMHFVRGHFKRRASGMFWWNTFVRGRIEDGFVSKDYELSL